LYRLALALFDRYVAFVHKSPRKEEEGWVLRDGNQSPGLTGRRVELLLGGKTQLIGKRAICRWKLSNVMDRYCRITAVANCNRINIVTGFENFLAFLKICYMLLKQEVDETFP